MNTKDVGERSEAQILAKLLNAGKVILMPFGDNQRYDLVIDEGGKFIRVQCKTGRIKNGILRFPTCSSSTHRGGKKKGYRGQIELLMVYCPDNNKIYSIPVDEAPNTQCNLRIEEPRHKVNTVIRLAKDYEYTGL
jgi:hypothetical protein